MRIINVLLVVFFLVSCASNNIQSTYEQTVQDVYFAGISFSGNYKDNKKNYPYSYEISQRLPLDTIFNEKLKGIQNPHINLLKSLGDAKSGQAIALSLAIDLETISVTPYENGKYKAVADLYAQLLVFDFQEKKVINSYPVNVQYITLFDNKPTITDISKIYEGFYTGNNKDVKTNLFDLAVKKLNTVVIKARYGHRLKVGKVNISSRANKKLKKLHQDKDNVKTVVAQSFSKYMVDNQNIAMLPYTKGQAIGGKMAGRFINGDIYNLEIPEADYLFDISIKDFKKYRNTTQSNTTDILGYFVYTNIKLIQPDLHKTYMNNKFRGTGTAIVMKGQRPDGWPAYLETMMNLYNNFSKNITETDDEWYENTFPPEKFSKVKEEFKDIKEILNHCR